MFTQLKVQNTKTKEHRRSERADGHADILGNQERMSNDFCRNTEVSADANYDRQQAVVECIRAKAHNERNGEECDDEVGIGAKCRGNQTNDGGRHVVQNAGVFQNASKNTCGEKSDDHTHGGSAVFFQLLVLLFQVRDVDD